MKRSKLLIELSVLPLLLVGCVVTTGHEHTFAEGWSNNETCHWHPSTCGHTDVTKDLGKHIDANKDGKCDVCGYDIPLVINYYNVTWKNYDGTILEVDFDVQEGTTPEYNGETPVKLDDVCVYNFSGWSPEVKPISENVTYIAQFTVDETKVSVEWRNYDGSLLRKDSVQIGGIPDPTGLTPTHPFEDNCEYVFKGWSKNISRVYEDTTYVAEYFVPDYCLTLQEMNDAMDIHKVPNNVHAEMSFMGGSGYIDVKDDIVHMTGSLFCDYYAQKDGTCYEKDGATDIWGVSDRYNYYQAVSMMFEIFQGLDYEGMTFDTEKKAYYVRYDQGEILDFYFYFSNKLVQTIVVKVYSSTLEFIQTCYQTYSWNSVESIEIPEKVFNDVKYRVEDDDVYEAIKFKEDGNVTATFINPSLEINATISFANNLLKIEDNITDITSYYDGEYLYKVIEGAETPFIKMIYVASLTDLLNDQLSFFIVDNCDGYEFDGKNRYYYEDDTYICTAEFYYGNISTLTKENINDINDFGVVSFSHHGTTVVEIPDVAWEDTSPY